MNLPKFFSGVPFPLAFASLTIAMAMALPLFYLVLRTVSMGTTSFGIIFNPRTFQIFLNSIFLAVVVTALSAIIAVPLAFMTVRTDLPWKRFWSVVTVLPLAIPSYVGSFAIISALGPRGSLLQKWLEPFGIDSLPSIYGWPGAVLGLTLFTYPYILLTVRGSLYNIDPALEEAARTLGYNPFKTFFKVTLPHLYPSIAAGGLLVALYSLSDFGTPALMRFNTFTRAIYIQYQSSFDRNMAAVLAIMLAALAIFILFMENKTRSKDIKYYTTRSGSIRPPFTIALGKWRWPAIFLFSAVVMVALIMPLGVISYWLFRGVLTGEPLVSVWHLAFNSVSVSIMATFAAIFLALPVAFIAVRFPGIFSTLVERSTYTGFALPGIVVALSLVFFGAKYATPLYQSFIMLVFAYVVLFIPQEVGTIRSSLLQVNPSLEEAARSMGSSLLKTLRHVTVPMMRSGVLTGAALVFISTMKELPATLLLAPTGFKTLATSIFSATDDAFFARAAAPALLLVAISAASMIIIISQEQQQQIKGHT